MEGSSTMSRLGLKGLFDIFVLQLYSLVDHFELEGYFGFVFDNNTSKLSHCLHLSSLILYVLLLLFIVYVYALESRSSFIALHLLLFRT